ncbi:MAG: T9SS type A sorting domain-containing protein, partial [Bacteroidales bacterium]|nr:T9SS type A sorting domain-containing protein [Bacteroidales bacterium]
PPDSMSLSNITGDASEGVLYNYSINSFWRSDDYGSTWNYLEDSVSFKYLSGAYPGEVYKKKMALYRSLDYGESFSLELDSLLLIKVEIGYLEAEVYGIIASEDTNYDFQFVHSYDFGATYDTISLCKEITGLNYGNYRPEPIRGASEEEIYLMTHHQDSNSPRKIVKIFYSYDYGETFELRYASEPIDTYYWAIFGTAGREPGSFYLGKARIDTINYNSTWLYLSYSNDTATTFKTYFHDLGLFSSQEELPINKFDIKTYPNPFDNKTQITFNLNKQENVCINVYSLEGRLIKRLFEGELPAELQGIAWNGKDASGNEVKNGVYIVKVETGKASKSLKLIKN